MTEDRGETSYGSPEEGRDREAALEAAERDPTVSDEKTCPQCGEPVHNLRVACPNCGHEYSGEEYDNEQAGQEYMTGAGIDGSQADGGEQEPTRTTTEEWEETAGQDPNAP